MVDAIPCTQLDITKEITALEKWVEKCVVIEGRTADSPDVIETALYREWPSADWIARKLLGDKRYLVYAPDRLRLQWLEQKKVKAGGRTFKVGEPTGFDIDCIRGIKERWYLVRGLPIYLVNRQTLHKLLRKWADVVDIDFYCAMLLDLRFVRIKLATANFDRVPACFEIELFKRKKRIGNVIATMEHDKDGHDTNWYPGVQPLHKFPKIRPVVKMFMDGKLEVMSKVKEEKASHRTKAKKLIIGSSPDEQGNQQQGPSLADASIKELMDALKRRLKDGYDGGGGCEGWVYDWQLTPAVMKAYEAEEQVETSKRGRKRDREEPSPYMQRRMKSLERSRKGKEGLPGPVYLPSSKSHVVGSYWDVWDYECISVSSGSDEFSQQSQYGKSQESISSSEI